MTSNTIYSLAISKPHSEHHLNRYLKFIQACVSDQREKKHIENHHILPRANDLFPEYSDFKIHPWNSAKISPRQHYIAHRMLWKAYGGSQTFAFKRFCDGSITKNNSRQIHRVTSRTYEILKIQTKEFISKVNKGTVPFRNTETSETGRISKEEFKANDLFVGFNKGMVTYRNIITGETGNVSKEEFHSNEQLVHITTGLVPFINAATGESGSVLKEEFYSNDFLVGVNTGTVPYRNIETGETGRISKEEFYSNPLLVSTNLNMVAYKNIETGEIGSISKEKFDSNPLLVSAQTEMVIYRNTVTGETGRISKEEFDSNDLLVGAGAFGTVPYRNTVTGETGRISKEEFDSNDLLVHPSKGMVSYRNIETGETGNVSKEEFDSNPKLVSVVKGVKRSLTHTMAMLKAQQEKNKINRICIIETQKEMVTAAFIRIMRNSGNLPFWAINPKFPITSKFIN